MGLGRAKTTTRRRRIVSSAVEDFFRRDGLSAAVRDLYDAELFLFFMGLN